MVEIITDGSVATDEGRAVINGSTDTQLSVNGHDMPSGDAPRAARMLNAIAAGDGPVSMPLRASARNGTLVIEQPSELFEDNAGSFLTGAAAEAAMDRGSRARLRSMPWPVDNADASLDRLAPLSSGANWDGPLVVSMPRTGSTLLGALFLLAPDAGHSSGFRFDRYIHEPAAPLFWQGGTIGSFGGLDVKPLNERDVVQESAYQFANFDVARWFVGSARRPIVFVMRHPQISWPSRWRIMFSERVSRQDADTQRVRRALDEDDYREVGDLVSTVNPPDNGYFAYMTLIDHCLEAGIDFVIVDNARFRRDPEGTYRQLCELLDITFDTAMTTWEDLSEALGRVEMSELARDEEYPWYYAGTLESANGIVRQDRPLLPVDRFPEVLRGHSNGLLSIDEAVTWYQMLLARPETLK